MSRSSKLAADLWFDLQRERLSWYFTREYRFHPRRKWRFDFAWVSRKLAIEVDGATFAGGRHARGGGLNADYEKSNEAAIWGWRIIRLDSRMIMPAKEHKREARTSAEKRRRLLDGTAVEIIRRAITRGVTVWSGNDRTEES